MVRQEHLESLVRPGQSDTDLLEARAVVQFIDSLLGSIKENLIAQNESNKNGPGEQGDSNVYMEISGDPNAGITGGLTPQ